uniref:Uncharacterized protein LOC114334415 n=1 Tax=Diabrotica virgifera virgifera TaxID=50390 RepID=A0A6P7G6V7_DIAVI
MKKIFLKAPIRTQLYKEHSPNLPLLPKPVVNGELKFPKLKKPCQVEDEIKITGRELETCPNESHEELHSTENSTKLINEQGQIEVRVTHELEDALNVSLCDVFPKTVNESELKRKLVRDGPYQPEGPFPRDRQGRCFSSHYYSFTTKAGIKLKRNWLCYSKSDDCVYFLPCWLFPQDILVTGINLSNLFSKNDVRDWRHISESIASHQKCILKPAWCMNSGQEIELL